MQARSIRYGVLRRRPRAGRQRLLAVYKDLRVGGAEKHIVDLLRALPQDEFDTHLLCLTEAGVQRERLRGSHVGFSSLDCPEGDTATMLWATLLETRRLRPDVVVFYGFLPESVGRLAAIIARVPKIVLWCHNDGDVSPRGRLRRLLDSVLNPFTDAFIGVAHHQVAYMTQVLNYPWRRVSVVHNGIEPRGATHSAESGVDRVVTISSVAVMRPEKDHENLLRAVRLTADRGRRINLKLVGSGPLEDDLRLLTEQLALTDVVDFLGERRDVSTILAGSDIFALTSYTVECFPYAVLEAMDVGLPVVATRVGGLPEMISDRSEGILVPRRDACSLADALVHLIDSPETRILMGQRGADRVRREFTLAQTVARAVELLRAA